MLDGVAERIPLAVAAALTQVMEPDDVAAVSMDRVYASRVAVITVDKLPH